MKSIIFYFCLALLLTAFLSCSRGEKGSDSVGAQSEGIADGNPTAVPDSIIFGGDEDVKEDDPSASLPPLETPDQQLDYMKNSSDWEKYESGILPQMTEDAPDYCRQILQSMGKRFIIVDKAKMKLFLYDPYGNIEKSYGIACAKNYGTKKKKGDSRTTEGCFRVKGVFDSTEWLFTDDNGYTSPTKGQYGPRFIRLNIPYIGIHGTGSPGSIGRRCSHGCIRVTNANILELVKFVEEGMPVIISPGPRDMAVNQREGSVIYSVVTEPGGRKVRPGSEATSPSRENNVEITDSLSAIPAEPVAAPEVAGPSESDADVSALVQSPSQNNENSEHSTLEQEVQENINE